MVESISPPPEADVDEWEAQAIIGAKVIEMCDRVKVAQAFAPGAVARWVMDFDGVRFDVEVKVSKAT